MSVIAFGALPEVVDGQVTGPVAAAGTALAMGAGLVLRRSYHAVDKVIETAENTTVNFVEKIGEAGIGLIPLFVGAITTLVLLFLHFAVQKYWPTSKDRLKRTGQNPEANVECVELTNCFPYLPWCSRDLVAGAVANLADAAKIAEAGGIERVRDTMMSLNWRVPSQTEGGKEYVVRLTKAAMLGREPGAHVRDMVSCGCPGYSVSLKRTDDDRVCKHCAAVLLMCLKENRRAPALMPAPRTPRRYSKSPPSKAKVTSSYAHRPAPKVKALALSDTQLSEPRRFSPAADAVTASKVKSEPSGGARFEHYQ